MKLAQFTIASVQAELSTLATRHGIQFVPFRACSIGLDDAHIRSVSELARRTKFSLAQFVRAFRGESVDDPRPNKYLWPVEYDGATIPAVERWNEVVRAGVLPQWSDRKPARQSARPPNHASVAAHIDQVRQHIRKGALEGRYLIVDESLLDQWTEVFINPLGVVDKGGGVDIRMINDYAYPDGASVNDFTVRDGFPPIAYNPPPDIARRIHALRERFPFVTILLMLGDVSGAFRHVPIHADAVHMFGFRLDGYVVIDLACGFGWCGSPAFYALAGSIINELYMRSAPVLRAPLDSSCFGGNVRCDDHTCVEVDTGDRCHDANIALRRAMLTVLGPTAVNEQKFTSWSTQGKALGLLWDTVAGTVSIPPTKLEKATRLADYVLGQSAASKKELESLLGVFRHVVVCFPPARAYFQQLQQFCSGFRAGRRRVPASAMEDLRLFRAILTQPDRFNGIPVSHFAGATVPSVHVYMDASNTGLCVLEPCRREYIRLQFSDAELSAIQSGRYEYSINVRELQSAVLAATLWGADWQQASVSFPISIRVHIDNTSAVAWTNRRSSSHPLVQTFLRLLSLAEFQFQLVMTAEHIAGALNTMADAGSRAWEPTHPLWSTWTDMSSGWKQSHALADSTRSKYGKHWTQWCKFTRFMKWSKWLPFSNSVACRRLSYFVVYLWRYGWNRSQTGNQISTIELKLASVLWYHRRHLGVVVDRSPSLRLLLKGIRRLSKPIKKKTPITPAFLRCLRRTLNFSVPRQRLLWGSVLLGFFFLLRRSEYLVVEGKRSFYCLRTTNAFFTDPHGTRTTRTAATSVTIGLSGAKNDQYGRGAWRTMHASGDRHLCPVKALEHILDAREALGSKASRSRFLCFDLSSSAVSNTLKMAAATAGAPSANYATHSIRIGGATALLNGQADSLSIKLIGRWMSRCFEEYPVQAASATTGLSRRML